jgi:hypothetical protein
MSIGAKICELYKIRAMRLSEDRIFVYLAKYEFFVAPSGFLHTCSESDCGFPSFVLVVRFMKGSVALSP